MPINVQSKKSDKIITQSYLALGNEALRAGENRKAIHLFNQALKQTPALAEVIEFNIKLAEKTEIIRSENRESTQQHTRNQAAFYETGLPKITIDIVVPVYNALEEVKRCLQAIEAYTDGFQVNVYVVNDASDQETSDWLAAFCGNRPNFILTENKNNRGYTPTVNIGLRQCTADYIVTLNSDAIVTKGWIKGLVRCFKSNEKIGVVGPLSNAASWQNVPILLDENNQFAVNTLPDGCSPDSMAMIVRKISKRFYPAVPFVNGFCFMISRKAFNTVGLLDEATFPTGYGEENDYCIRVAEAGFELAICDDTYVFHAKSKSFGHEKRKQLSKIGSDALKNKHGKEKVNELANKIREMSIFTEIRAQVQQAIDQLSHSIIQDPLSKNILFLLPVSGGGGGVHSIVQETMGMRRVGVNAKIAVPRKHRNKFIQKYNDITIVEDLFLGFEDDELVSLSKSFDVVIGTIYTSMKLVKKIIDVNKNIQPAYYIQDYEPFFSQPGTPQWQEAYDSYSLVPSAIMFAKTDWICQKVYKEHGVEVLKVSPSIDHEVYKPNSAVRIKDKIVLSAMIRPKTPRRGAERTMSLLKRIHDQLGDKVQIELFGCDESDVLFEPLERNFNYINNGELSRLGVAKVLQRTDCFIDLSDYQAFGRTGLEAMACGAFILVTQYGGIYEYAKHLENAILVDPFEEIDSSWLVKTLTNKTLIDAMKRNSILTAASYSIHKAAISELCLFS